MVSLYKVEKTDVKEDNNYLTVELRCLSTDTKPTDLKFGKIDNGSQLIEIDTGTIFFFDIVSGEWKEV